MQSLNKAVVRPNPEILSFQFESFQKHQEKISHFFRNTIALQYGDQTHNINAFSENRHRFCEVMVKNGKSYGVVACLDSLVNKAKFEVRNLALFKQTHYKEKYLLPLLQRAIMLAKERQATSLQVLVAPEDQQVATFLEAQLFQKGGEEVVSKDKKKMNVFLLAIESLKINNQTVLEDQNKKRKISLNAVDTPDHKKHCPNALTPPPPKFIPVVYPKSTDFNPRANPHRETYPMPNSESASRYRDQRQTNEMKSGSKYRDQHQTNEIKSGSEKNVIHSLPMKGTQYLNYIKQGKKLYEGRVNVAFTQKILVGHQLKLFDHRAGWGILCAVEERFEYQSFREMVTDRGVLKMLPQLENKAKSLNNEALIEEAVRIYQGFPGSQRVHQNGCVAIQVKYLYDI